MDINLGMRPPKCGWQTVATLQVGSSTMVRRKPRQEMRFDDAELVSGHRSVFCHRLFIPFYPSIKLGTGSLKRAAM